MPIPTLSLGYDGMVAVLLVWFTVALVVGAYGAYFLVRHNKVIPLSIIACTCMTVGAFLYFPQYLLKSDLVSLPYTLSLFLAAFLVLKSLAQRFLGVSKI